MQKLAESEIVEFNLFQESSETKINDFSQKSESKEEIKYSKTKRELQLELLLSNLLKYGVFLASAVVLLGGILYLIRHGSEPADYRVFHGVPSEFRSPDGIINAVLSGSRRGIIQLGLLILVATPIVRVAISFLAFLRQRDYVYIAITSLVLSGLIYSLIGAYH